jgi:hypothetical protein
MSFNVGLIYTWIFRGNEKEKIEVNCRKCCKKNHLAVMFNSLLQWLWENTDDQGFAASPQPSWYDKSQDKTNNIRIDQVKFLEKNSQKYVSLK